MTGIMQVMLGGSFAPAAPTTIGQAFGGGFYAGKIAVGGGGVATHYLIVAPKATGEASKPWGPAGVSTGATSLIDGPANTTLLVALGSAYEAAIFCNNLNAGSGLNGYTDWYMPAKNELEVLYFFLKPDTASNETGSGSNANAVSPEPVSTNYTSGSPSRTTATGINGFRTGEANAFNDGWYRCSTETYSTYVWMQNFTTGFQNPYDKTSNFYVRAVRRIPI